MNGSRELRFLPGGSETSVKLTSSWPHPSFTGAPLPDERRSDVNGFSATWRAPYFGRGYPPRWTSVEFNRDQLKTLADASAFGVMLMQPVDIYQQAERAVKYASLFIVMTFVIVVSLGDRAGRAAASDSVPVRGVRDVRVLPAAALAVRAHRLRPGLRVGGGRDHAASSRGTGAASSAAPGTAR